MGKDREERGGTKGEGKELREGKIKNRGKREGREHKGREKASNR